MSRFTVAEVQTRDFMGVRLVEFKPKRGAITMLTGKSNAGKSSVIQSLWHLFLGKAAAPEMGTRRGAKGYQITVKIDGEKEFSAIRDQNRLDIKMAPGCAAWGSPQAMLDSITNEFMLNPIKFVQLGQKKVNGKEGKREQVAWLLDSLELGANLEQLKAENAADFKKRTAINAEARRLEGEIAAMVVRNDLPRERPDLDAIRARIKEVNEHNSTVVAQIEAYRRSEQQLEEAQANEQRNKDFIAKAQNDIERLTAETENLKGALASAAEIHDGIDGLMQRAQALPDFPATPIRLANALSDAYKCSLSYIDTAARQQELLTEELAKTRHMLKTANQQRRPLAEAVAEATLILQQSAKPVWMDTSALINELDEAQTIHREMDKQDRRNALTAEWEQRRSEAESLTLMMDRREEQKNAIIANAKMPVEGLSFVAEEGKEEILYKGIPLSQQGEATQIKVSIAIGLAANPALRLILIPNGEALDDDSLAELEQMAEEQDFQVIMAKVDSSGSVGIVLEEGQVKVVNEPKSPKERRSLATE